jgi:hypothetical protein
VSALLDSLLDRGRLAEAERADRSSVHEQREEAARMVELRGLIHGTFDPTLGPLTAEEAAELAAYVAEANAATVEGVDLVIQVLVDSLLFCVVMLCLIAAFA